MRIVVIGAAGRMGRWLVSYFLARGYEVHLHDIQQEKVRKIAESSGAKLVNNLSEAVGEADLIVLSTPINVTPSLLKEINKRFPISATVMEISSLKSGILPILKEISIQGLRTVSIHPLFGPGVKVIEGERIVLVPVSNRDNEMDFARKIFPKVEFVIVDAEEHDRAMALTLSLPHFVNIAFASVIGKEDLSVLKQLGGTTFTLQTVVSEGVMTENPDLYASIQMSNRYTTDYLSKFISTVNLLKNYVIEKDSTGFLKFYKEVHSALSKDLDFSKAYERMYRARCNLGSGY